MFSSAVLNGTALCGAMALLMPARTNLDLSNGGATCGIPTVSPPLLPWISLVCLDFFPLATTKAWKLPKSDAGTTPPAGEIDARGFPLGLHGRGRCILCKLRYMFMLPPHHGLLEKADARHVLNQGQPFCKLRPQSPWTRMCLLCSMSVSL